MRSLVVVVIFLCLVTTAHAQSATGIYAGVSEEGWFPHGRLAEMFSHKDNGAQFSLIIGARWKFLAIEAWDSPAMQSGISVWGLDAKLLLPLGRYMSTYARLRLGHMTVDLDPYETDDHPLSGFGGGEAVGFQANLPARLFGTWGAFLEFGHERYELGLDDGHGVYPKAEGFWHYAYGVTWGTAF